MRHVRRTPISRAAPRIGYARVTMRGVGRSAIGVATSLALLGACGPEAKPRPAPPPAPIPARVSKSGQPVYRVHPTHLDGHKVVGDAMIVPDADERSRPLRGVFELCLDETGHYESGVILESTGSPRYDAKIARSLTNWVYRPFLVDGVPVPFCTTLTFLYGKRRGI